MINNLKKLLLGITILVSTSSSFSATKIIDKVAAIVNNDVILESEVDRLMESVKLNAKHVGQKLPNNETLRDQILERLILDQITLQIGKKMNIKITDKQIDHMITSIANQNGITVDRLRSRLASSSTDYSAYRNQIHKDMLISEIRNNAVRHRIKILPQEVEDLAKKISNQNDVSTELNLSQILIPFPKNPTPHQIAKAENHALTIAKQARNSKDFDNLVSISSLKNQKVLSKRIGWRNVQELPSIFTQALIDAKKGDITGLIRSEAGFHILKVNDLRNQKQKVFVTEMHIRHILLKSSPIQSDDQVRNTLQKIADNIKNGQISFSDAAKNFSQDLDSANYGGDLGWAPIDSYNPVLKAVLINLKKNQVSTPIHSSIGWHLIELLDTRNIDKTDDMQKDYAYRILFHRKFSEEIQTWMQEQRASTYVKVLNN